MHLHHLKGTRQQPETAHHPVAKPSVERKRPMHSNRITTADAPTTTRQRRHAGPVTRALRTLAVLALSCMGLLTTLAVQAQTDVEAEIWSATLTPAEVAGAYGWDQSEAFTGATLSNDEFTYGGDTYTLAEISADSNDLRILFTFAGAGDIATQATREELTLYVDGTAYKLEDGTFYSSDRQVRWTTNLPDWSSASTVALRMTGKLPPSVKSVELTSDPGQDGTFAIGDSVKATVTFNAAVDITGTPQIGLFIGSATKQADCASGTNTKTMVCSYTVVENDTTVYTVGTLQGVNGVGIQGNSLALNSGTIYATGSTTNVVDLDHDAVPRDTNRKVDGIRPFLVTLGNNGPQTTTDGTKVVLKFSEKLSAVDRTKITIQATESGTTTTLTTSAATVVTGDESRVELTLTNALTSNTPTLTVALAADAVTDLIGNGNSALTATSVTNNFAPAEWELTLTDSSGNAVTELIEDGDSATATVSITNGVTLSTNQIVQLNWGSSNLELYSIIEGAGDVGTITITAGQSSGSLEISAVEAAPVTSYELPLTQALTATLEGTVIGTIAALTFTDNEAPPVVKVKSAPTSVNEGESIEVEISLNLPFSGGNSTQRTFKFTITDADSALSGTLQTSEHFEHGQKTRTVTLTAADNSTMNDGGRDITFTLAVTRARVQGKLLGLVSGGEKTESRIAPETEGAAHATHPHPGLPVLAPGGRNIEEQPVAAKPIVVFSRWKKGFDEGRSQRSLVGGVLGERHLYPPMCSPRKTESSARSQGRAERMQTRRILVKLLICKGLVEG